MSPRRMTGHDEGATDEADAPRMPNSTDSSTRPRTCAATRIAPTFNVMTSGALDYLHAPAHWFGRHPDQLGASERKGQNRQSATDRQMAARLRGPTSRSRRPESAAGVAAVRSRNRLKVLTARTFFGGPAIFATDQGGPVRLTRDCYPSQGRLLEPTMSSSPTRLRLRLRRTAVLLFGCMVGSVLAAPSIAEPLDLARHHGRVVIVDFWASWCKPCRQSIPWLNTLRERYGASGLTIIGVNVDAERRDADRFLRDVPIDFEIVFDPDGALAKQFNVQAMPSTYIFDRTGKLVKTHLGFRDAKKVENEAALKNLLNQPAQ